jgi:WD40 repeat protein
MRRLAGIRLSRVNTGLLVSGATLLLASFLGRWVTIGGNQILRGAPWWVQVVLGGVGLLAIAVAVATSREPSRELETTQRFLGVPPRLPGRLVARLDMSKRVVGAMRADRRLVALAGIGGAGKSTVAASACWDRRVQRRFRDGVIWLDAGRGREPVGLLADLARRLGMPDGDASFVTVDQGRDKVATALQGKHVLIAVDNVWERGPIDAVIGLAPDCSVIFTTRLAELAAVFGAVQIRVDRLVTAQALKLMGRWMDKAPEDLPADARTLCTRVGNLALGVAMTGAMVARGRSPADVLALMDQDLGRVHADMDPEYQYRSLRAAIEAGISDLSHADQRRYEQLAVFTGRNSFPREAAEALWQPELTAADVGDLLAELTGRSLLTATGDTWYTAHDLQYDVLSRRLSPDGRTAANRQLLRAYGIRYAAGWSASASDQYLAGALISHLHQAGLDTEARAVLRDIRWIQARLAHGHLHDLISDYGHVTDPLSRQIAQALRLSEQILGADPGQVRSQLAGRLMDHSDPAIAGWAADITRLRAASPWLAAITPALTPTTGALRQVLNGHTRGVLGVAVSSDGTRAVTSGRDGTWRLWDLTTGRQQAMNTVGYTSKGYPPDSVPAVAITSDGTKAIICGAHIAQEWDLVTYRRTVGFQLTHGRASCPMFSVAVSADGTRAVVGCAHSDVRVWSFYDDDVWSRIDVHCASALSVALTDDARIAVIGRRDGVVQRMQGKFRRNERAVIGRHDGPVWSVAIAPGGTRAISGGDDRTVRVWDVNGGGQQDMLTGHSAPVRSVAVSADGMLAVSGSDDGTVQVWDLATARRVRELVSGTRRAVLTGHSGPVRSVAVSADGMLAVSGSDDGTVRVWDLAIGSQPSPTAVEPDSMLAVTADGTFALKEGENGTVLVWNKVTDCEVARLDKQSDPAPPMVITQDNMVAIAVNANALVVWDLPSRRPQAQLVGHRGPVSCLTVTADGTMAISGGIDRTVRVWDLTSRTEIARWTGDHPLDACAALPGEPLRIAVKQQGGQPYLLQLHV